MKKFYNHLRLLSLLAFLLVPYNAIVLATPIDLNDFYMHGAVWVNPAGNLASIFGQYSMVNNSAEGDPGIWANENTLSLTFNYLFLEPFWQDISFSAWLYDAEGATVMEFETTDTFFDHAKRDLAELFAEPTQLGLDFSLSSESGLKNKGLAFIHNPIVAPNPATLLLLSTGLLGITGLSRKQLLK